jgi:hypothetical protein
MKINTRILAGGVIALLLAVTGLLYATSDRLDTAARAAGDGREATLHAYRIAQALKSLSNGYELAMNEYYSTVLEYPIYRQKAADHQAAIAQELAALAKLGNIDTAPAAELARAFKEMETYRIALEAALSPDEKDWDAAREALFKVNVVSVRAIQQADILARVADERARSLDRNWQAHQADALTLLRVAMAAALVAGIALALACLGRRAAS